MEQTIEFNEELHKYIVDGKEVPSITELIDLMIPSKYDAIPKNVLAIACEYGKKVHSEISNYIKYKEETYETIEARNVIKFIFPRFSIKPMLSEHIVAYKINDMIVAMGTIDLVYRNKNNEYGLADFKTTSIFYEDLVEAQLNLYKLLCEQSLKIEISELTCIRVHGDTRKVKTIKIDKRKYEEFLEQALEKWNDNHNKSKEY